ncbi:MAG TPA: hemolysin family protein [Bacteroidales bacterium]|nr:hemolysin family protein [Bacteroidales bacterium]HPF02908.1 hemolysin family protein [Bacteroidales bacterium]HPJ60090.1 hemolysin family protein [Bacteroidales bacterium]HPR13282.1 hemolysin family protein [Bacteroidales bacterium]HRW85561.1 hemolysin family protein [Bacteroidales bacterium]
MDIVAVILVAMIFSGFFSGMEIAFVSSNKLRIELDRKQGIFSSDIIRIFTGNPGQYIATMLIGNNLALVIYGLFFARLFNPILHPLVNSDVLVLVINTVISTVLLLLFSEFLPKTLFLAMPNFFLRILSIPTLFFFLIFYPVSKLSLVVSNFFLRIFTKNKFAGNEQENIIFTKVDLDHFVGQGKDISEEEGSEQHNIKIFQNALDFSNVKLRECMVPRTEIQAVEANSSMEELKRKFIDTQHSRILVYSESIDNITGYFELTDIYRKPPDILSAIRKLAIVPETMSASRLLKVFVGEKQNIALVVDEFGGTSGIVTIEDVLEEIVGDIEDEHDVNEFTEKIISPEEFIFSGRLEIDYLNEKYHLNLPEKDDYETLAGMILYLHGSIPSNNDTIRVKNMVFKILRVSSTRIELVNLKTE